MDLEKNIFVMPTSMASFSSVAYTIYTKHIRHNQVLKREGVARVLGLLRQIAAEDKEQQSPASLNIENRKQS